MNIQRIAGQAARLLGDAHGQARAYLAGDSDIEEPTAGDLWEKASPDLVKALAIYDKKESPDTPESSWNPFAKSKAGFRKEFDTILDALLSILGTCGADSYRTRVRKLQADVATSEARIVEYREQMLSARKETDQNFVEGLVVSSKEALVDQIADERDRIAEKTEQIENLKAGFRKHLEHINIFVSPETADSFLLPIEDNIVSMAAVISNIGRLTGQLQHLVDESKEAASETKRYYGIYVLLVLAVDRIQNHFVSEIDADFLPKLRGYEEEAAHHIKDAKSQISRGGPREQLSANIEANRRTIEACRLMAETLQGQRQSVLDENRKVRKIVDAAVNSYRTVCLSFNVAELIGFCESAFRALRELRLPQLRPFQGVQLNAEMQRLAKRMVDKD